jgi:Ser/Thr protein kinase RdoA (MazF antagonist)
MNQPELSLILSRYPSRFAPTSPIQAIGGGGGLSGAALWRFRSAAGTMLLRARPAGGPGREHIETVHGWLRAGSDLGFLALPVVSLEGRTITESGGRLWQLELWMPGAPDLDEPPALERIDAAFSGLASLHRRLAGHASRGTSPGLAAAVHELEDMMGRGFDEIDSGLRRSHRGDLEETSARWLVLARAWAPRFLPTLRDASRLCVSLQPCLRDARPEHFLFEGDRLTGVVDYGAMGLETVAADLARLIGEWLGGGESLRGRALAVYQRVRPLDDSELALTSSFELAGDLLIGGHWLRWHFLEGRRFEDPGAVARGLARGLRRLTRRVELMEPPGIVV